MADKKQALAIRARASNESGPRIASPGHKGIRPRRRVRLSREATMRQNGWIESSAIGLEGWFSGHWIAKTLAKRGSVQAISRQLNSLAGDRHRFAYSVARISPRARSGP